MLLSTAICDLNHLGASGAEPLQSAPADDSYAKQFDPGVMGPPATPEIVAAALRASGNSPAKRAVQAHLGLHSGALPGVDYRFTVEDGSLYAIALRWPGRTAVIKALASEEPSHPSKLSVRMLGDDQPLQFRQTAAGLEVQLPEEQPCQLAFVLEISGLALD